MVLDGQWSQGRLIQTYVSATNVGTIEINCDPDLVTNQFWLSKGGKIVDEKQLKNIPLNIGQEIGKFHLGSTVVALIEVPASFKFSIEVGESVRFGQSIG